MRATRVHTHAEADPGWASTHRLLPVCARSRDSGTRVCTPAHARAGTWGARWRAHTRASAAAFLSNHACTLCAYLYTRMNTQVRPHAHMCMHTQRHTHVHSHSFLQPLLGATTSVYTDRCVCAYGVHRGTPLQVHARSRMTQAGLILGAAPLSWQGPPAFWADLLTLQLPGLTCRSLWGTSASRSLLTFHVLAAAGADWLGAADSGWVVCTTLGKSERMGR